MPVGQGTPWIRKPMRFVAENEFERTRFMVSGITKGSTGTPIGGCTVDVFSTNRRKWWGTTVSDGNGVYSIEVAAASAQDEDGLSLMFYAVAYKAGAPDLSGTTVNTLVGS